MTNTPTAAIAEPLGLLDTQPDGLKAMYRLEAAARAAVDDDVLYELIKTRASQINGCGFCIDMHTKDALAAGETPQRLVLLDAWSEAPFYDDRERAALAVTEAVTRIGDAHVPKEVESAAIGEFGVDGYAAIVLAATTINAWNRFAIASHNAVGSYEAGASL